MTKTDAADAAIAEAIAADGRAGQNYKALARRLAHGETVPPTEINRICLAARRTVDDLKALVAEIRKRIPLAALVAEYAARAAVADKIEADRAKTKRRHEAALAEIDRQRAEAVAANRVALDEYDRQAQVAESAVAESAEAGQQLRTGCPHEDDVAHLADLQAERNELSSRLATITATAPGKIADWRTRRDRAAETVAAADAVLAAQAGPGWGPGTRTEQAEQHRRYEAREATRNRESAGRIVADAERWIASLTAELADAERDLGGRIRDLGVEIEVAEAALLVP